MSTIRVDCAPGRMCPVPGRPGAFIGLRRERVNGRECADAVMVSGGYAFFASGPVELPDTADLGRALRRGDCVLAPLPAPAPRRAASDSET